MNAFEFDAVVYDGSVYCVACLPDGVDVNSEDVSPIFADSEWDYYPVCEHCHGVHDYVSLTVYGQNMQTINDALAEHARGEFDGLVVSDTSEVPEDYDGMVLHINDHGNAELYQADFGVLKSIASRV